MTALAANSSLGERTNAGIRALTTGRKQFNPTATTAAHANTPSVEPPAATTAAIATDPAAATSARMRSNAPCPSRKPRAVTTGTPTAGTIVRTTP